MKKFALLILLTLLSACGTTSKLHSNSPAHANKDGKQADLKIDLSHYNHLIIEDFTDGVSSSKNDPVILSSGKTFADLIANKVNSKALFSKVERNVVSTDPALLINGEVTQHTEGSMVARTLIGLGAW